MSIRIISRNQSGERVDRAGGVNASVFEGGAPRVATKFFERRTRVL